MGGMIEGEMEREAREREGVSEKLWERQRRGYLKTRWTGVLNNDRGLRLTNQIMEKQTDKVQFVDVVCYHSILPLLC